MNSTFFNQRGFTLLELLASLFIIGIMVSMAVLSVGNDGPNRITKEAMTTLKHLLTLASRESVINHQEIGVHFFTRSYEFLLLNEKKEWSSFADDPVFRVRPLPKGVRLSLHVEGVSVTLSTDEKKSKNKILPHLVLFSSGEMIPFRLEMVSTEGERFFLSGTLMGILKLSNTPL